MFFHTLGHERALFFKNLLALGFATCPPSSVLNPPRMRAWDYSPGLFHWRWRFPVLGSHAVGRGGSFAAVRCQHFFLPAPEFQPLCEGSPKIVKKSVR